MTPISSFSNTICLFFKLIILKLLKAQSHRSRSKISITSKSVMVWTPLMSTMMPVNLPIGTIFCWLVILNCISNHCNFGFPINSQVFLGNVLELYPKSIITKSISYFLIYAVNVISFLVLFFCYCKLFTMQIASRYVFIGPRFYQFMNSFYIPLIHQ